MWVLLSKGRWVSKDCDGDRMGTGQAVGAGRWGWDSPSKGVYVRQVEADVLDGGASGWAWGRSGDLHVWTGVMIRPPMDAIPREGWQMQTEVTNPALPTRATLRSSSYKVGVGRGCGHSSALERIHLEPCEHC